MGKVKLGSKPRTFKKFWRTMHPMYIFQLHYTSLNVTFVDDLVHQSVESRPRFPRVQFCWRKFSFPEFFIPYAPLEQGLTTTFTLFCMVSSHILPVYINSVPTLIGSVRSSSTQLPPYQLARRDSVFGYPKQSATVSVGSVLKWRARSRRLAVNWAEDVVDERPIIIGSISFLNSFPKFQQKLNELKNAAKLI
jgi:hypothetical protein